MSLRTRIAIRALALCGLLGIGRAADAQPPAPPFEMKPVELQITPQPAPVPALRYRLFPLASERTSGDAAPIYLRLSAETIDEAINQIRQKPHDWLLEPLDRFPLAEAKGLVDGWASRLIQIEYGARRRSCDWNYTLPEQREHSFEILLPDVQEMRMWSRLTMLKARVEVVERKYPAAIRTIETGLAFGRHVSEAPFLINSLVGIASSIEALVRVEELIGQPDAPNLYWALTSLPRPLIGLRYALEHEQKVGEWVCPEITDLDRPQGPAEWSARLVRLHARISDYGKLLASTGHYGLKDAKPKIEELSMFREHLLPEARIYLKAHRGTIDGLSDDEILVRFIGDRYREVRDDLFKASYLSLPEAIPVYAESRKRLDAVKDGPLGAIPLLSEAILAGHSAETRLDRKVAVLRTIEAIRMQAASDGGKLPDSLAKVTVVPVPIDPVLGKPFDYRREGDSALLGASPTGPHPSLGLSFRLTIRK